MTDRLFGTDGIRGAAGVPPLDPATVTRIGAALVRASDPAGRPRRIVIGRDTRESGEWIEAALTAGAVAAGARVTRIGVAPTPAVAFLASSSGFDAGVVISASHNPFADNGLKVFGADGRKLDEVREAALEAVVLDDGWTTPSPPPETSAERTPPETASDLLDQYRRHVRSVLPEPAALGPMRLAVDCANGAMAPVAPKLFEELGFDLVSLGCEPDGRNINDGCGSTYPEPLAQFVAAHGCRLGVAFDGDGDRAILVDHRGRVVDGDAVLFICAKHLQRAGRLPDDAIVATVMSNIGLEKGLEALGIGLIRCAVGDKYVMETLVERRLALGGEQSGHVIFSEILTTGDGLITTLMVLQAMAASGRELDALAGELTVYPQVLVNVKVREKVSLDEVPDVARVIDAVEARLAGQGRLLVRYSGTEPLLRIMLEGPEQPAIDRMAGEIADSVRRHLG
ncbi:MAG: phosphoglucosamine mutase [Vicinamibacterales bacterium]|jgi:phosphoglucosamine mutase|nr:phosphoglucosamine mutase [Acidobacteriota bacterium]MDP6372341.1 phosphoglucosamine mutase [Vicinamibacterales bacterium]MDP6608612.1 phosphoglucosamine mutase [Vicinamibacterales bacterium]HAK54390.1 phosphoglucosamine mutase [Acidobacteriota bacterium]|tara:strand:- start:3099 stop:4460 length:1362 start_codon:yes stop_codon:yes gene_type:complete